MICWFCGLIEENKKKSLNIDMYGEVDSQTSDSLTKVAYNVRKIVVPRCVSCNSRHKISKTGYISAVALAFVLIISSLISFFIYSENNAFILGGIIGLLLGLSIGAFLLSKATLKGIKSVSDAKKTHPQVKELLIKNYKFGVKPKDYVKESQSEPAQKPNESAEKQKTKKDTPKV